MEHWILLQSLHQNIKKIKMIYSVLLFICIPLSKFSFHKRFDCRNEYNKTDNSNQNKEYFDVSNQFIYKIVNLFYEQIWMQKVSTMQKIPTTVKKVFFQPYFYTKLLIFDKENNILQLLILQKSWMKAIAPDHQNLLCVMMEAFIVILYRRVFIGL